MEIIVLLDEFDSNVPNTAGHYILDIPCNREDCKAVAKFSSVVHRLYHFGIFIIVWSHMGGSSGSVFSLMKHLLLLQGVSTTYTNLYILSL